MSRWTYTCEHCGGPKRKAKSNARYCSAGCKQAAHRKRLKPSNVTERVTVRSRRWQDALPKPDYRTIFSAGCTNDLRGRLMMAITTADEAALPAIFQAIKDQLPTSRKENDGPSSNGNAGVRSKGPLPRIPTRRARTKAS